MHGSRGVLVLAGLLAGCASRSLPGTALTDGQSCEVTGYHLSEVRTLQGGEPIAFGGGSGLATDGELLYYGAQLTSGSNSADDVDLFALDTRSGKADQLTRDDLETLLLDARRGRVLYAQRARGVYYTTPWRLLLREGGTTLDLGAHALSASGHHDLYAGAAPRLLDGGRAAWATETQVLAYDGSSTLAIAAAKHASAPFLAGGTIVFSASDGKDFEVHRHRAGALVQLSDNTIEDRDPVIVGDEVLWLCGTSICRASGGETEVLDQGECSSPSAGGGSAAWGCSGHLVRYTPGQPPLRIERPGTRPIAVRVDGAYLAWVEPDGGGDGYHGEGTLRFSDGARSLEVARVGLPCLTCDAYWPPLRVSLSGALLAWSYAIASPTEEPVHGNTYGYVRVIPETSCR